MNNFRKYKVQKGETIEIIAAKIGMPAFDVRAYHNRYCELSDLVELGLPIKWAEYILLPPLEADTDAQLAINIPEKIKLGENNCLRLTFENGLKKKYGTIILYKENNQLINKVHFTSQIEFLKKYNDFSIVEYQINQVYINNKEPEMVIEQLADKTSKILYPIVMSLNKNGEIHEILNIEAIQKRWEILKPSILEYYKGGDIITKLISSFERSIQSASRLKRNLAEHPFYTIYFASIYQNYLPDLSFTNNDSELETFQSIDEFQSTTSKILVRRKGIVRSKVNFEENLQLQNKLHNDTSQNTEINLEKEEFQIGKLEEKIHNNMDFQYKLNHTNNSIFSIVGFINTRKNSKTISTVEFETYERVKKEEKREAQVPISKEIDWNAEIINEKMITKRGFWDGFWGN
ncbi:hypothetical protein [Flavobacterium sp. LM4]|uniref:hypothetical protein n=1 Tax=Flavobacterium sp. LM4 TaxID=1938609 RepID=UPI000993CEB2|nr:hypothetical protein [Flavobacterium sp. LM4]OOV20095.1 hypothetical protein BXU10_10865 [Flavobacterium sp. LM4]